MAEQEQLVQDLAVAEILLYFAKEQPDWQLGTARFVGKTSGTVAVTRKLSKPTECSTFTPEDLENALKQSGNRLAGLRMSAVGGSVCLPPHSTFKLDHRTLGITNPFGVLRFEVVPSGSVSYIKPGSRTTEVPTLADGKAQFETRVLNINITNRKSALYSQHRDVGKYEGWRKSVVSGLQDWFQ